MVHKLAWWCVAALIACTSLADAQTAVLLPPTSSPPSPPPPMNVVTGTLSQGQDKELAQRDPPAASPDKLGELDQKLDAISKAITITTADPNIKVVFGGAIIADFLWSRARPEAPG